MLENAENASVRGAEMTVSSRTVHTLYLGMRASYRTKHKPSHTVILLKSQQLKFDMKRILTDHIDHQLAAPKH